MSDAQSVDTETVTLQVNGREIEARKGEMVIQATDRAGIYIPRFCYHKHLPIAANCRMCLVEVEKAPKPLPACATPVGDGMKVHTHSERALSAQRGVMEFLLINHPLDCPICDQGGECELQDLALGFGRGVSRFTEGKRSVADEDLGPLVATEMTRCIHCTRCVRFLDTVAGKKELGGMFRGEHMEISTYVEEGITSELSGNIIDLCPVGALTNKPFRFRARAWEMLAFPSVAPHDGLGSNIELHALRGEIMRVVPRENEAINQTWIADRDRYGIEGLRSDDRLTRPLVKRNEHWVEVPWEIALDEAAARLQGVVQQHGADALGALLGPTSTLEELYLAARLARGLGSPNVDHRLRDGDTSDQEGAPAFPYLGQPIAALAEADTVLLLGAYARHEHPMLNHRLRRAALGGAQVFSLDGRARDWNFPNVHEAVCDPASWIRVLGGVAAAVSRRTGVPLPEGLESADGQADGVDAEGIAEALQGGERVTVLLGNMGNSHPQAALLRALGQYIAEAAGGRFGVVAEAANTAGGWLAGAVPHRVAGGREAPRIGRSATEMARQGQRGYLLLNLDPACDPWDPAATVDALQAAESVVAITPFADERMRELADVLLPMAAFGETAGTFVNTEGRWQSFRGLGRPMGEARPGWRILRALGTLLELEGFGYENAEDVRRELVEQCADVVPSARYSGAGAAPGSADYPGEGSLSLAGAVPIYAGDPVVRRSAPLQRTPIQETAVARMSGATAREHDLDGARNVRITGTAGSVVLPLVLDDGVAPGSVWIPAALRERAPLGPPYGRVTAEAVAAGSQ